MKKLRLNKLFHWLYAFLMLVPVFVVLGRLTQYFGVGDANSFMDMQVFSAYFESGVFAFEGVSSNIWQAYDYLLTDIFGFGNMSDFVCSLLTYWTIVSAGYLVFDVLMLPINIAHHWIDKGSDRL